MRLFAYELLKKKLPPLLFYYLFETSIVSISISQLVVLSLFNDTSTQSFASWLNDFSLFVGALYNKKNP